MCVLLKLVKRNVQALKSKKRRFIFDVISCKSTVWLVLSGYLDSNQGPPAPKAGALTGLRYTPKLFYRKSGAKVI